MDPLRIGLVGYGGHGPLFRMIVKGNGPQVLATIVAVADRSAEACQRADSEIIGVSRYGNINLMLIVEDLDAVVIATPPHDRGDVLVALERNLPVFCENPLAFHLSHAEKICSHPNSLLCCVDDQWPLLPRVFEMLLMVDGGMIGSLLRVKIGGKGRHALNEEILRIGTHLFNVAHLFTGDFQSCVAAQFREGSDVIATLGTKKKIPLVCEFMMDKYNVGRCYLQLEGTTGRLRAIGGLLEHLSFSPFPYDSVADEQSEPGKAWIIQPYAPNTWPIRGGMEGRALTDPGMNPTWQLWERFVTFVRGQGENPFPPEKALPAVKAMHLIRASLDCHKPVVAGSIR